MSVYWCYRIEVYHSSQSIPAVTALLGAGDTYISCLLTLHSRIMKTFMNDTAAAATE